MSEKLQVFNRNTMVELLGDDDSLIAQFIEQFLEQAKSCVPQLIHEFKAKEYTSLKETAHFFKTSAKAIGAEVVGEILQEIEYSAEEKSDEKLKSKFIELNKSMVDLQEAINEHS